MEALHAGLSESQVDRRVARGDWEAILRGVYRLRGYPSSWRQLLMAAVLWGGDGAVVSHIAAAVLWRLDGFGDAGVEISLERKTKAPAPWLTIHTAKALPNCDVTAVDGIPVTTVSRTLIDVAANCDVSALESALECGLRRRLTTVARLNWRLRELRRHKGVGVLRRLVAERDPALAPTASDFESRLHQLLKPIDLPPLIRQYQVYDGRRFVGRPDFAWPHLMIAIEADSYGFHGGRALWEATIRRRNALVRLGWIVIPVTWDALTKRPDEVLATIRAAYYDRINDPRFPVAAAR